MSYLKIINSWVLRLNKVSSINAVAAAILFWGSFSLFYGPVKGFYVAIASYSIIIYLERMHSKAKTSLVKRSKKLSNLPFIRKPYNPKADGNPVKVKVINQFEYEGFRFNPISIDNNNIPNEVTRPLCPRCKENSHLVETSKVIFPGRIKIVLKCKCGFSKRSKKTKEELYKEARIFCGG